jgi:hypothetical protein
MGVLLVSKLRKGLFSSTEARTINGTILASTPTASRPGLRCLMLVLPVADGATTIKRDCFDYFDQEIEL